MFLTNNSRALRRNFLASIIERAGYLLPKANIGSFICIRAVIVKNPEFRAVRLNS